MDAVTELAARGRERLVALGLSGFELGAPDALARAFGYSDFLYGLAMRLGPEQVGRLLEEARRPIRRSDVAALAAAAPPAVTTEHGLARIALRELTELAPVRASLIAASLLAERVVGRAVAGDGEAAGLVVFALGKLGGRELNFYSDLDLVFAHAGFFGERDELGAVRAVRRLLARLDGSFRVDLRLRPFGTSGPLVMGLAAMESYFQHHGRDWERYAWVKARAIAGDRVAGRGFLARLRPFIYRRYLDYHAMEALRAMKRQIAEEAGESERDIKRGPGGIREIEFVVQAFQLVRGGRSPALAGPRLAGALAAAVRLDLLSTREGAALAAAYRFLRRVENRLQMQNLTPLHRLPEEREQRMWLAGSLGYPDWRAFARSLERHRRTVRDAFSGVFGTGAAKATGSRGAGERLWQSARGTGPDAALLAQLGFVDPEGSRQTLVTLRRSRAVRLMSAQGRVALDRVMPKLLETTARLAEPDAALARLLALVAALVRRSAYLALLAERPAALERLCRLAGASEWVARRLAAAPVVLDELLDPRLVQPLGRGRLAGELRAGVTAQTDPDLASARLRETNEAQRLKIAAGFMEGGLSAAETERALTQLAELSLRASLAVATRQMGERHGALAFELLVIGYGKLGSLEFGFASDLDLVFVYECESTSSTGGLAAETYLARLAQRTISLLAQPTAVGGLYAVDTRLRPEGTAGLLISSFAGWRRYQHEQARLWEHQALLKARPVAGSAKLAQRFREERRELLRAVTGSQAELAREIVAMRARVASVGPPRGEIAAALLDGEFLAAYWLLAAARDCPAAVRSARAEGQLAVLAAVGREPQAATLGRALEVLRTGLNRRVLGVAPDQTAESEARRQVSQLWQENLGERGPPL